MNQSGGAQVYDEGSDNLLVDLGAEGLVEAEGLVVLHEGLVEPVLQDLDLLVDHRVVLL